LVGISGTKKATLLGCFVLSRVDKKDADRILLLNFKIQTISTNRYKQCSVRAEISRSFQIAYNNSITFFRKCAEFSEATGICFIRSFIGLSVRFICVIIDLFARKVIACTISKSNGTCLTKSTLTKAVEERHPNEGLIFHSDRGTNYTARTFVDCCKAFGLTQSLSRKSTPYDNSVMEAFFKTLKAEELYRNNYRSEREFKERVGAYIEFYNSKRPHQINRYRTPDATEESYYKRHTGSGEEN
jgi:transposase InsO family protein